MVSKVSFVLYLTSVFSLQGDCFSTAGVATKTTHHESKLSIYKVTNTFEGACSIFYREGVTGIIKIVTPEIIAMPESRNYK